jgi:hypothetical protein
MDGSVKSWRGRSHRGRCSGLETGEEGVARVGLRRGKQAVSQTPTALKYHDVGYALQVQVQGRFH